MSDLPKEIEQGDKFREGNIIYSDEWSHGRKNSGAVIVEGWDDNPIPTVAIIDFTAAVVHRYNLHDELVAALDAMPCVCVYADGDGDTIDCDRCRVLLRARGEGGE